MAAESHGISDREQDLMGAGRGTGENQPWSQIDPTPRRGHRLTATPTSDWLRSTFARAEARARPYLAKNRDRRARRTPLIQRRGRLSRPVIGPLHPSATPGTTENKAASDSKRCGRWKQASLIDCNMRASASGQPPRARGGGRNLASVQNASETSRPTSSPSPPRASNGRKHDAPAARKQKALLTILERCPRLA